jgi:hypothetical protein
MIGLLRWTFVVPVLASAFVNAPDEATRAASVIAFQTIHQFGGVILVNTPANSLQSYGHF